MTNYVEAIFSDEEKRLCRFASLSKKSQGRLKNTDECIMRTPFQRDRDRIIHSKAFRRLMHKTQCFLSPEGDHYRTRLTHTLEVAQVARTAARLLSLNEDLAEAISLGHDLGHTPFGHAGERALEKLCPGGFSHNVQSLRVVDILERNGEGLNLTNEVRDGILCHTGEKEAFTAEGRLIKFADKIAYINHDIDDAIRAGILRQDDIPLHLRKKLGFSHGERINTMIKSLVDETLREFSLGRANVTMDAEILSLTMELRQFMFDNVYTNPKAKGEEGKACALLESLYRYFVSNPDKIPEEYKKYIDITPLERVVCDYIAGMTDRYAIDTYSNLFLPRMWGK